MLALGRFSVVQYLQQIEEKLANLKVACTTLHNEKLRSRMGYLHLL